MGARHHPAVVLFVGADDEDAARCARVAAPLPVVRAKRLSTALDRVRSLRPVAVVVSASVPSGVDQLSQASTTKVVELEVGAEPDELARFLAQER